jgi:peptidoglycan DL-endopeptidase CwlO
VAVSTPHAPARPAPVRPAPARPAPARQALARPAAALVFAAAFLIAGALPADARASEFSRVKSVATAQLGDRWVWAARGPHAFDCVGLVYYAYRRAGLLSRIGGQYRTVKGYWSWFASRGRASRSNGRPGDLVIWGGGKHIGIYLGKGRAISTLVRGVRVHGLHAVNLPFTTFLHVRIGR